MKEWNLTSANREFAQRDLQRYRTAPKFLFFLFYVPQGVGQTSPVEHTKLWCCTVV